MMMARVDDGSWLNKEARLEVKQFLPAIPTAPGPATSSGGLWSVFNYLRSFPAAYRSSAWLHSLYMGLNVLA